MKLFLLVIAITLCIANAGRNCNKLRSGSSQYGNTMVECPQVFNIKIGSKCFHIGPPGIRLNWITAKEKCGQMGGHLAILDTAEKNSRMYDYINNNKEYGFGGHDSAFNYWIGAYDLGHEGVWYWDTVGKPFSGGYTNWAPNEPNNANSYEHCLACYKYGWNDFHCFINKFNYICEHYGNVPQ